MCRTDQPVSSGMHCAPGGVGRPPRVDASQKKKQSKKKNKKKKSKKKKKKNKKKKSKKKKKKKMKERQRNMARWRDGESETEKERRQREGEGERGTAGGGECGPKQLVELCKDFKRIKKWRDWEFRDFSSFNLPKTLTYVGIYISFSSHLKG